MGIVILILVMVVTFYLGRYALREGLRIEDDNKIMENLRKMEQRDIMDSRKEIIYERNPDTGVIRSRELEKYGEEQYDGVCEGEYVHENYREKIK